MKNNLILAFCICLSASCENNSLRSPKQALNEISPKYVKVTYTIDVHTPTVGIRDYTLISNDLQRDSAHAREIISNKVMLPLAMQQHNAQLFDRVLAKNFIYHGEEAFFNRDEYIHDRVNGKWMISDVQYENLVLEFFGEYGVLTYRNKVIEKDEFGKEKSYLWFWTDVWINENGVWKLKDLRAIN